MNIYLLGSFLNVLDKLDVLLDTESKNNPENLYITTALSLYDEPIWPEVHQQITTKGYPSKQICISDLDKSSLEDAVAKADVIYITGGNTFYLLQEIYKTGFNKTLKDWFTSGKTIVGESAGAVVLGPSIEAVKYMDDPSKAPDLHSMSGLALVNFLPLVHFDTHYYSENYPNMLSWIYESGQTFIPIKDSDLVKVSPDGSIRFL